MAECFELEDGVAHLRRSRPEAMNSMTPAFWRELPALVTELSDGGDAFPAALDFRSGARPALLGTRRPLASWHAVASDRS